MPPETSAWSDAHVRRLLWRAGFGATPQEAERWAAAGRTATIGWLVRGPAGLEGPEPTVKGARLQPENEWAHDALWWLDRMVRSRRPLEEKLTLFWHDHFATTDQDAPLMLAQNRTLRANALGSFRGLLGAVARDRAMMLFLSLADSRKEAPNENFARELFELFTIGGGYTERDVREASRAFTGYRTEWRDGRLRRIRFDPGAHDHGVKRVLGRRGRFGPGDVLDLAVRHPRHPPFLVRKLWDFFVGTPPAQATVDELARVYRRSGLRLVPVVERILGHPALYAELDAPWMVKSPVVYVAGTLRTTGTPVTTDWYGWMLAQMGQMPFRPPSVAGWDWGPAWLSSGTMRSRLTFVNAMLGWGDAPPLRVPEGAGDPALGPDGQLELALGAVGRPWISAHTRGVLNGVAARFFDDLTRPWQQGKPRRDRADMLQRLLRNLLLSGPDAHLH